MKVTVNKENKEKAVEFPKLMAATDSGAIVLMYRPEEGVALDDSSYGLDKGEYYDNWNMDMFQDFNGTVTLQND